MKYIGIDLGGTNTKGALVSESGEILREASCQTQTECGTDAVCDNIAAIICTLAESVEKAELGGIGLGCPGTVDDDAGIVRLAANLGFANYDSHRPNISSVISGYKQPSKSAQSIEITGFIEKSKPPEIIFFYTLLPLTA